MQARPATFLDSNAGAPLLPRVAEALLPLLNRMTQSPPGAGNPSSLHSAGRRARSSLQQARDQIATSIGVADSSQITFTSSGTEAIQLALNTLLSRGSKAQLITTAVEHDATFQLIEEFRRAGGSVSFLELDDQGRPKSGSVKRAWKPGFPSDQTWVSLIWVNNETGVITDAKALAREASELGAWVHVDAAQAWGKIPVNLRDLGAHAVSFSAHKIGALSGTGVLWTDSSYPLSGLVRGKQEQGRRGGTENLLGIVAAGVAAASVSEDLNLRSAAMAESRDGLQALIQKRLSGIVVNGAAADRVPNTLNFSIEDIDGTGLVQALDLDGFEVSAGAACSSGIPQPSRILLALGRNEAMAKAALRISMHEPLPLDEATRFVDCLEKHVTRLRAGKKAS